MLWFSVWALLVLGTLTGAFFLVRSVYRSARALLDEVERAIEVLERLTERVEELADVGNVPAPVDLVDPEPARARLADARARRMLRRVRRSERHEATFRRWQAFTR